MTMVPILQSKNALDILKDFEPVSLVATVEWGLIANNQTSYKSAADLIAAARRRRKDRLRLRRSGSPSIWRWRCSRPPRHIATHVPYKGATGRPDRRRPGANSGRLSGLGTVGGMVRGIR